MHKEHINHTSYTIFREQILRNLGKHYPSECTATKVPEKVPWYQYVTGTEGYCSTLGYWRVLKRYWSGYPVWKLTVSSRSNLSVGFRWLKFFLILLRFFFINFILTSHSEIWLPSGSPDLSWSYSRVVPSRFTIEIGMIWLNISQKMFLRKKLDWW